MLAALLNALGRDRFAACFKIARHVEVMEAFHNDLTLRPEVEETARPFLDDERVKPYKPTLRLS